MKPLEKTEDLKTQEETLRSATEPLKLPEDVAKIYSVGRGVVRVFVDTVGGGLVDLNKVSLAKAEKLAARGILIKKAS